MKLDENFLFKLKTSCDIYSIFSSYVELRPCGSNMRCCCPFHAEKTPSCFVYGITQSFYCFGCGVGGDVITFIEKIENLPYSEAVCFLAQKVGIDLPQQVSNHEFGEKKALILKMNRMAAKFFHRNLFSKRGADGLHYLKSRKISEQTITRFGLGYALDDWNSLKNYLCEEGFTQNDLAESGLVLKSKDGHLYDKFRNRVMFPIISLNGEVVGFGGRVLDDSLPKYLNSPDSVVFKKGLELFGLNFVKKSRVNYSFLILCEGYMDVISMHQNGFINCVAALGTSLTKQQVFLISRNFSEVILAFDSDSAGRFAVSRACDMFDEINFKVRVLKLKNAKDPDEYIKKFGPSRFKILVEDALSFEDFVFGDLKSKFDLSDADERRKMIKKMCVLVSKMNDSIKREIYIGKLCSLFNLTKSVVLSYVCGLIAKNKKVKKRHLKSDILIDSKKFALNNNSKISSNFRFTKAQEEVIRFLFSNPSNYEFVCEAVDLKFFDSGLNRKIFEFLIENFKNNRTLSVSDFHKVLNSDEMGEFSRIINEGNGFEISKSKLLDQVVVLREEFEKRKENILKMSLNELELKRQQKAKLKI